MISCKATGHSINHGKTGNVIILLPIELFLLTHNVCKKLAQTIQNIWKLTDMKVKIKSHKKWQISAIIQDISDHNL